jgi:hypothetical protein
MQFKARYLEMGKLMPTSQQSAKKGKASGLRKLIRETQSLDDDEDFGNLALTTDADPSRLWHADFKNYVDTLEAKPLAGMTTVQWWGVSIFSSSVHCN